MKTYDPTYLRAMVAEAMLLGRMGMSSCEEVPALLLLQRGYVFVVAPGYALAPVPVACHPRWDG